MKTFRQRIADGELVMLCGAGRLLHHNLILILGVQEGFHGLWIDMEHVDIPTERLEVATMAARSIGLDNFCRVAPTDYAAVTRCLEAGAGGVMAAQIHTAKQAEEFVRWAKFAPRGARGLNTGGYDAQFSKMPMAVFCEKANCDTLVIIQIETAQAVEECEAIAAIEGVDSLFIGPADLSQSLGVTGQVFHEKCLSAIDRVSAACREHGKFLSALAVSPDHADLLVEKGCRMIAVTSDVKLVVSGIEATKRDYARFFRSE